MLKQNKSSIPNIFTCKQSLKCWNKTSQVFQISSHVNKALNVETKHAKYSKYLHIHQSVQSEW